MRNPSDSKKRPRDESKETTFSLTSLRKLEMQLGDAMSQAGIASSQRKTGGSVRGSGVNRGSSGPIIYSLGNNYNRGLFRAIASENSFSEVSASQTIKNSFATLKRQLNANYLRSIYNEIKDIPRAKLDSYNLNLLCELKNVFLEIDRDEELSRKNAPRPPTAGEREAQLFAEYNQSRFATQTRRELNERNLEERSQKRQRTSENWWDGLTANFVPAIGEVTNNILSSSFLENFGISFSKPEQKKSISDPKQREEVVVFTPPAEKKSAKSSSTVIEDRPYKFLCELKDQPRLESSKFSTVNPIESSNYLLERIKLWNKQLKKFNSVPSPQEYHDGSYEGYAGDYQKCILEYQKYLQAGIKKIETSNLEQGKILSGFLYLELAKVEHMVTGKNAYVDDGSFSTREVSESWYSKEGRGLGVMDSMPKFASKFSSSREYKGDEVTPPYYQFSQPSNSEGLCEIRNRLYSKIPKISQHAIYDAQKVVSGDDNFVDRINVPWTAETSQDFKSKFSEERTKFWNPTKKRQTSETSIPKSGQNEDPDPSPKKRLLSREAQSVKDKISGNSKGVKNLQRIVDSPINFSESILDVTSNIDIAIGVMKPNTSEFDLERFEQENDLKNFLKDSKGLLKRGDAARGRSSGSDPRRENIYAYVAFLDNRIKILQDVVNDLKSSNPSQEMSIKTLKEMQANLGLELVRISDSFTPKDHFISKQDTNFHQSPAITSGLPNGLGSVHHEHLLKTLRKEEMKEKLGPTFASMLDKNRFKASKSFAYSDNKVASANQDFLKSRVDKALKNFNNIRIENRGVGKGR